MKKIIDGKLYNTETAKLLGSWESEINVRSLNREVEELYRTKSGNFFIWGQGGPGSRYRQLTDENSWTGGELIRPVSEAEARKWAEEKLDVDTYESIFGEVSEGDTTPVSVLVPPDIIAKLEAEKAASGRNRTDIILAALREYLK